MNAPYIHWVDLDRDDGKFLHLFFIIIQIEETNMTKERVTWDMLDLLFYKL